MKTKKKAPRDLFDRAEEFVGRLSAWIERELAAISAEFQLDPEGSRPKRKKPASRAGRGQARSRKRARRAKTRR